MLPSICCTGFIYRNNLPCLYISHQHWQAIFFKNSAVFSDPKRPGRAGRSRVDDRHAGGLGLGNGSAGSNNQCREQGCSHHPCDSQHNSLPFRSTGNICTALPTGAAECSAGIALTLIKHAYSMTLRLARVFCRQPSLPSTLAELALTRLGIP